MFKPRTWLYIATLISIGATYYLSRNLNSLELVPNYNEMPIVVSPFATIFMSSLVFGEYLEKKYGNPIVHFICSQLTVVLCVILAASVLWWVHLLLMLLIFGLFVAWDAIMIRDDALPVQPKTEVASGNIYINLPTLAAILTAFVYLIGANMMGTMELPLSEEAIKRLAADSRDHASLFRPMETFITGLVAFHLLVSAFSYWVVSYGKDGKIIAFWKNLGGV